ncbi:MAG: pseudouridine-5'-phosphate glycosidase, partial [Gemmatimonadaceae bacterium]
LPGFFTAETGIELDTSVDDVREIAAIFHASRSLSRPQAILVVQAPPAEVAIERGKVESAVDTALLEIARDGVRGAAVTPYLLASVTRLTGGSSLAVNLALLEQNAALAGEIATMCAGEK